MPDGLFLYVCQLIHSDVIHAFLSCIDPDDQAVLVLCVGRQQLKFSIIE